MPTIKTSFVHHVVDPRTHDRRPVLRPIEIDAPEATFDGTYVLTTHDGERVRYGVIGDRLYVEAPWEILHRAGYTARGFVKDACLGRFQAHDAALRPGPLGVVEGVGRKMRPYAPWDAPDGAARSSDRPVDLDRRERDVRAYLEACRRVDGIWYAPTFGASVHPHGRERPVVPLVVLGHDAAPRLRPSQVEQVVTDWGAFDAPGEVFAPAEAGKAIYAARKAWMRAVPPKEAWETGVTLDRIGELAPAFRALERGVVTADMDEVVDAGRSLVAVARAHAPVLRRTEAWASVATDEDLDRLEEELAVDVPRMGGVAPTVAA